VAVELADRLGRQIETYGVDVPYIQAHVHGPDSSSVRDLDDLPTVLRDEEVAGARDWRASLNAQEAHRADQ
jgi:hypothetical protein